MSIIEQRNARKVELQIELTEITVEELIESSMRKDSWYQGNVYELDREPTRFWECLPKYIADCRRCPPTMSSEDFLKMIEIKVSQYKNAYSSTQK